MALAPSLRPLIIAGKPDAPHTLDIFRMLSLLSVFGHLPCCGPSRLCLSLQVTVVSNSHSRSEHHSAISRKIAVTIDQILKPWVDVGGRYEGKIKIIFRNQVQPWHGASTFTHEAGLAVTIPGLSLNNLIRILCIGCPRLARRVLALFSAGKTECLSDSDLS